MPRYLAAFIVALFCFFATTTSAFAQEKRIIRGQLVDVDAKLGSIGLRIDAPSMKLANVQGFSFKKANVYLPNYTVQPGTCDLVIPASLRGVVGPWGQAVEPACGYIVSVEMTRTAQGWVATAMQVHGKLPCR